MTHAPTLRVPGIGLALIMVLVGCGPTIDASPPMPTATASPTASARPSPEITPSPTPPGTPAPTDQAAEGEDFSWTEAASFGEGGTLTLVTDISAWDGGWLAIGHRWQGEFVVAEGSPRLWTSPDGRSWSEAELDLGTVDVELRGILRLADGGVVMIGEVGRMAQFDGSGDGITAHAWRSTDGRAWTELDVPFRDEAELGVRVASGPIGHVVSTGSALWYSPDGANWQRTFEASGEESVGQPVAGDEGFVAPVEGRDNATVLASGDGLSWFEGRPPAHLGSLAPWRGDWLASAYIPPPEPGIAVVRSANGLDWSTELDVNDLTPPDGPKAGLGMESGITEVTVVGEGGVAVLTLGWNHCCARPPAAVGVFTSTDGSTWTAADLPDGVYVTSVATDGDLLVLGGHLDRGGRAVFWVADR